ncbi:helix-turn-helix transcriptional regulator [Agromyces arachidis]|uniref:helix-turn-helix transcriptional regulator n=1 Tax=Agromyces arachidis TaxID=766966 RepID=UPI0040574E78
MPALDRSALATADPEVARAAFAPLVPRLQFGRIDPEAFRVRLQTLAAPGLAVFDYAFAAQTELEAGADQVSVVSARGRGVDIAYGGRQIDVSRPYANAVDGMLARWETFSARAVILDRSRIAEVARMTYGGTATAVIPAQLEAKSGALGRYWDAIVSRVVGAMSAAPEAFDAPIVAEAAFSRLAVAYLSAFHVVRDDGRGRLVPVGARSAVVRTAVEYLHAHAGEPITVAHVAAAVHISSRGLHAAFVAETGRSPSEHLRGIRLEGVRDELRFAPPSDTIAVVARRWGFVHLPRFAQAYQQAFGELPSATRGVRRAAA